MGALWAHASKITSIGGAPDRTKPPFFGCEGENKRINVGYCSHPVTVHIRGPIKGYIMYNQNIFIIQLLLRGAVPKINGPPFKDV